ncbi:hypothetical protein E3N88_10163 [Mikania micrantha]|uniref:Reverse transcriptase Ty1/copia-type domain-containing protein n=1 Tax=Mikania micrantha TaxID=192012 RepID=A0A5N6PBK8_9ASTR|nr:hypothetical protein E3N88_10163 [Mikania micrantha]
MAMNEEMEALNRNHTWDIVDLPIAIRLLRYLKEGILIEKGENLDIKAFVDSDWGKCFDSRRSVTGLCVFIGQNLVYWKSKKQSTVSGSSAEAEYRSMCAAACEILWLLNVFKELGRHYLDSTTPRLRTNVCKCRWHVAKTWSPRL